MLLQAYDRDIHPDCRKFVSSLIIGAYRKGTGAIWIYFFLSWLDTEGAAGPDNRSPEGLYLCMKIDRCVLKRWISTTRLAITIHRDAYFML